MTDYLEFMGKLFHVERAAEQRLQELADQLQFEEIIDICSGAGGPWRGMAARLQSSKGIRVKLSDLYPNQEAKIAGVTYLSESIDARSVPKHLNGFRTIFTAFHHFAEDDAVLVLQDAVRFGKGVLVVEVPERSLWALLCTALIPISAIVSSFFIRPFSVRRILFSTVIPVVPLCAWFDGVVSCFRAYTPAELEFLGKVADPTAQWRAYQVRVPMLPVSITILEGFIDRRSRKEVGPLFPAPRRAT